MLLVFAKSVVCNYRWYHSQTIQIETMSCRELCQLNLSQYALDSNGDALFSDKVISRFAAMSALADCYLVSAKGTVYPVHKVKLLEQSKVLGWVRCC